MSIAAKRLKNKPAHTISGVVLTLFPATQVPGISETLSFGQKVLEKSSSFWGKRGFFVTKSNINSNTYH